MDNHIMIIDDDPDALLLYSLMVTKLGYSDNYQPIMNAKKALKYLGHCRDFPGVIPFPDLIAVDLSMPGLDGFQFLKSYEEQFSHSHPDTKIVVLTSSMRNKDYQQSMEFNCVSEFISKPLKSLKLLEMFTLDNKVLSNN